MRACFVGGELFEVGFSVSGRVGNVVKVAAKLIKHGVLGDGRETGIHRGRSDGMDDHSGVYATKESASFVGGTLFAFVGELG